MQPVSQLRKFYTIIALSMIVAGSARLIFSVADVLAPKATCHGNLDAGVDILRLEPAHCVDPFNMVQYNNFILIILAICLLALGGAIVGMIMRLSYPMPGPNFDGSLPFWISSRIDS